MKKSFFSLMALVAAVGCVQSVCAESLSGDERIYIQSRDVHVRDGQILVHLNGQWGPVPELYADGRGIYLMKRVGLWYCKACGWHNEDIPKCYRCGNPRPQ